MTYSTGYDSFPKSLAIADLNNDNYLDIVVANYGTNNIGLFFGHRKGRFEDAMIYSTGVQSNPSSVVIGDINNDNYLDIIVANYGTNNIGIFIGYGNTSFNKLIKYSTGSNSYPEFLSVGDFNKDNRLDIIAVDTINNKVYILSRNENGTFPLLTTYLTDLGSGPVSVRVQDLNSDNQSDVLIVNRDGNNIRTLINYDIILSFSYNIFTADTLIIPSSIATGDLNGDNLLDIIVIDEINYFIKIFLGYGNGSFTFYETFPADSNSSENSIGLGDFNNDRHLDIAILIPDDNSLGIFLGVGDGTFSVITKYSTKTVLSPQSLSVGDMNNDNCSDVVIVSKTSDLIGIFISYCNGTFLLSRTYKTKSGWGASYIVMDDFNNDNQLDLAIGYSLNSAVSIFYGDGDGRLSTTRAYTTPDVLGCSSIASGDLDNDNQRDIVVTLQYTISIAIFFGDGSGVFPRYSIIPIKDCVSPVSLVVGDFDGNIQTDIAVTCLNSYNIVILFGDDDNTFSTQKTFSTGVDSFPSSLVSADYNNDTLLDIAVANEGAYNIGIFMNYYKANFAIQTEYSTGSGPHPYSVAIADFNNDNILDIVVVNSGYDNIGIRFGFGNGSFGIETTYSTGVNSFPQHVKVADFNRDNHLDIVISNHNSGTLLVYLGYGNGSFGNSVTYLMDLQFSPTSIDVGDFNNDKWLDLAVISEDTSELGIFYGYNYATFYHQETYSTGPGSTPAAVSVNDLNNDNRSDIVIANQDSNDVSIFFGHGNGSFMTSISYSTGNTSNPSYIAVNDLNNDTHLDIIVVNLGTKSIGILFGYGNGTFHSMTNFTTGSRSQITAVVVGDINNDNRPDVLVTDTRLNTVGIFLGVGNGSFLPMKTYSTGTKSQPSSIALGDLNNDNYLDIVVANSGTDSVSILQGFGNGSFALIMTYALENGSNPSSVTLSDLNNDTQLDIAVSDYDYGFVNIFLGFGNGSFSTRKIYSIGIGSSAVYITVNDFNNDGLADIAFNCEGPSAVVFLFGTRDGGFLMGRKYSTTITSNFMLMAFDDFNNDSRIDMVIIDKVNNYMDIYHGNGNEFFGIPSIFTGDSVAKPHSIAVGDFNNDNLSDIVVANYETNDINIVLANDTGEFLVLEPYSTGNSSHPYAITIADFNEDYQLDIAVVNYGSNDVIIFQGYGNGSLIQIGSYSSGTESNPSAIAVSDFNNDKYLDLAIVNYGTNYVFILFGFGNGTFGNKTSYAMGYNSRPNSIAVGDFNNDSSMDMAIANYGTDNIAILSKPC